MIRPPFILLWLLCCAGGPAMAQTAPAGKAIGNVLDRQSAAWNRGDIEGYMEGYWHSDSLMFIGKKGITYGWQQTLDNYRKSYPDKEAMGKLRFDILRLKPLSDRYCQVVGRWHLQRSIGDLEGYFTLLFEKVAGQWVIVSDHSS
ncbi:YybH family protein [Taibaiella koreensis]|uniref:YybH family protein n=1 Tax=Taibaiella koreensis TaxID=1268548 RepID=UPI000E599FF7|nr:DUF4440 domain-containing protein [Taibaiella koreensis]